LFFVTGLVGRAWCGYFCFQTLWSDLFIQIEHLVQGERPEVTAVRIIEDLQQYKMLTPAELFQNNVLFGKALMHNFLERFQSEHGNSSASKK
jgi:polyferredoxin